ncbi:uncharacterized protein METZ01_LOCUS338519, partial [marine metagenome]
VSELAYAELPIERSLLHLQLVLSINCFSSGK